MKALGCVTIASAALWIGGCSYHVCDYVPCGTGGEGATAGAPSDGGGGQDGGGGSGASGGGGGGEGGAPPLICTPTEGEVIGPSCGVFVELDRNGNGTQGSPFSSLSDALSDLGEAERIYICGEDVFERSVDIPAGVSVYGGLRCADWSYGVTNPKPTVLGDENVPAVRVVGDGTTTLWALRIQAPNATTAGSSSIALLVSEATLNADEVELVAGDGFAGAAPPGKVAPLGQANGGATGANAQQATGNAGGGTNTCGATSLAGGQGGNGGTAGMGNGGPGNPGDLGNGGEGGIGQRGAAWNCNQGGGNGGAESGNPGADGEPGPGATTSLGSVETTGFLPANGSPGDPGEHGRSGGGGGGSRGAGGTGAGGGGGGAGGCGGAGAAGGNGGGSSIALLSLNASVTLDDSVTLSVGAGGAGGAGGQGQFGQLGGGPGPGGAGGGGALSGCFGGSGGSGGNGGNGGGGRGGHAIAIAYQGAEPTGGTADMSNAAEGAAGPGGDNAASTPGGNGAAGVVQERQQF